MKKFSFFALAIVGMLFAGCSADRDVAAGPNDLQQGETNAEGYMSLDIKLPTTPSVRAANDDYDDGTPNEYRVYDCALLLFEGATPETASFVNAQDIPLPFPGDTPEANGDNVTTTYQVVAEVSGRKTPTAQLWALVFLNYKNVMEIDNDNNQVIFHTKGSDQELANGTANAFAAIRDYETSVDLTTENGSTDKNRYFFMANAVLSKAQGGEDGATAPTKNDIVQLVDIDGKVYSTPELALANPAGDILVERAVAKATLDYNREAGKWILDDTEQVEITIDAVDWYIDNTEPTTYIARNPGTLDYIGYSSAYFTNTNYRFVGGVSVNKHVKVNDEDNKTDHGIQNGTVENYYRTYWCVDPTYSLPAPALTRVTTPDYTPAGATPLYCHENTFSVANQNYKNTTRAVIRVKTTAKVGNNPVRIYSINNDGKIYTDKGLNSRVIAKILSNVNFNNAVKAALKTEYKEKPEEAGDDWKPFELTTENFTQYFNLVYKARNGNTGLYEFDKATYIMQANAASGRVAVFESAPTFTADVLDDIAYQVNTNVKAYQYDEEGTMYYEARFKHFAGGEPTLQGTKYVAAADDLAPWNFWEEDKGVDKPTSSESYPGCTSTVANEKTAAENNYLGRYGMVRNNWYDVMVTEFKKPGSPVSFGTNYSDDPDTQDDNINDYISVRIHVLSWAKRTQSWGF